ncbi:alpha/beta fold hydrolase [Paenibacillus azoreducens]|uniref:MxaA domain-containing protein n=1 Tax=Paenibacillus azoreducens TaxID=116718 RepID=A0A920CRI3_9BACL|nr:alpha/beta fold hydrolase [Paenibacillus azoreducens]GIO46438.1 MxaA domain-containing protein [Paenibacillus azoreducens]
MDTFFITGSTGFIGKELLKHLAIGQERLLLLVRNLEKTRDILKQSGLGQRQNIYLLQGDLGKPGLGLSDADYRLAQESDVIVHAGGTMDITLSGASATQTFLEGAGHVGKLAEDIHRSKGLRHMVHVVGYMSPFRDDNVDLQANVRQMETFMSKDGAYERMKFLADLYLRQQANQVGYPLSVVNPATVIGAFPAGVTEQLGGLGVLVHAVRRGLMPVIPGGPGYWVPFVANDILARVIVHLARSGQPASETYTLLGRKQQEPDMKELLTLIAATLGRRAPFFSAPLPLITRVLRAGIGKWAGIPAESLAFVTNRNFDHGSALELLHEMGTAAENPEASILGQPGLNAPDIVNPPIIAASSTRDLLPYAVADLDYRFTYRPSAEPAGWNRDRKGNLAVMIKEGTGNPWVLIHGWLSGADDLIPLAEQLHMMTGRPVWLPDLPGFGRSPMWKMDISYQEYVDEICRLLDDSPSAVHLAGHSFGSVVAAEAAKRMPHAVEKLTLLQPLLHRPHSGIFRRMTSRFPRLSRHLLSAMPAGWLSRTLLREGVFSSPQGIPDTYVTHLQTGMSSPRIAAANANMLRVLEHELPFIKPEDLSVAPVQILWGELDQVYSLPGTFSALDVHVLQSGHHFPLENPAECARLMNAARLLDAHAAENTA